MLDHSPHLVKQNEQTALHQACFNGHHKVVEYLLRAGANPDMQDEVRMGVCPVKQGAILRKVATVQTQISSELFFSSGTPTVKKASQTPHQDKTTEVEIT